MSSQSSTAIADETLSSTWSRMLKKRPRCDGISGQRELMRARFVLGATRIVRLAGFGVPPCVAAALIPARTTFSNTEGALVMVVAIVGVAAFGDRIAGVMASASAGLSFDFFLTRPYERFAISHRQDIETTVLLFVVGLAVTELTARGRRNRLIALERSKYLEELHAVTRMMAEGAEARIALARVEVALSALLDLKACRYDPLPPTGRVARIYQDGSVVLAGAKWPTLPGREVDLPIEYGGRAYGRFVLVPTPGRTVSLERRRIASAFANDIGAILAGAAPRAGRRNSLLHQ